MSLTVQPDGLLTFKAKGKPAITDLSEDEYVRLVAKEARDAAVAETLESLELLRKHTRQRSVRPRKCPSCGAQVPTTRRSRIGVSGPCTHEWHAGTPREARVAPESTAPRGGPDDLCSACGATREACQARQFAYPKWCCPTCKESGGAHL